MRWSPWLVLVELLIVSLTRTPLGATAVATGLFTAGYGAQSRGAQTAVHVKTTVLAEYEQCLFRAVEQRPAAEDPEFAERLRTVDRAGRPRTIPTSSGPIAAGSRCITARIRGKPAVTSTMWRLHSRMAATTSSCNPSSKRTGGMVGTRPANPDHMGVRCRHQVPYRRDLELRDVTYRPHCGSRLLQQPVTPPHRAQGRPDHPPHPQPTWTEEADGPAADGFAQFGTIIGIAGMTYLWHRLS